MRRLSLIPLAVLTLVTGCGASSSGSGSAGYADLIRTASTKTSSTGSSMLALTSRTTARGRTVTFDGSGAFDYSKKTGRLDLHVGSLGAGGGATIVERITGGALYLQLPTAPGSFYKLELSDLAGTSLAAGSDPTSSLGSLAGVSGEVSKVGTEQVRGEKTTHYRGTIDVQKALARLTGVNRDLVQKSLVANGVKTLPFDAYLDAQGRLRKYVQHVTLTAKGQTADSTTTVELYEFGTKVDVTAPPASQVKDGAPLLAALKAQASR